MKKIAGVIKVLLIVLAALLLIHLLLRWKPLDQFLTSKIGSPVVGEEVYDTLIRIEGFHDSLPETEKPYVYSKEDRLYVIYKGTNIDITPPGVSPVFFSEQSEFGERIKYRDHACFDAENEKLMFVVDVQNVPRLFIAELGAQAGTAEDETVSRTKLIANNVDSFLFLGGEPVYAEGYAKFNTLYLYRDGGSVSIAENGSYVPVPEADGVLWVGQEGALSFFEKSSMSTFLLSDKASEICRFCVFGDNKMLVYARYEDNYQTVMFDRNDGKTVRSVVDHVPDGCWSGGEKAYVFDSYSGKINGIDAAGEVSELFGSEGHIYKVFTLETDSSGEAGVKAVFATKNGIFKGVSGPEGGSVTKLSGFKGELRQYSRYPQLITYYLEAAGDFENGFYITALSRSSFLLNRRNPLSWLNRFSSYVYKLFYVSGGKVSDCGVTVSRSMSLPESVSEGVFLYAAKFGDGGIKSISVLRGADVLLRDALKTEGMANGSGRIEYEIAGGRIFVTLINNPGSLDAKGDHCVIDEDYTALKTMPEEAIVSFGTVYDGSVIGR